MLDAISKTTIRLLMQEPFFGHLCAGMQRELDPGASAMTIGLTSEHTLRLLVPPDYWSDVLQSEAQRLGALKHQLLHIALKHVLMAHDFAQRRLFWIAADLVVNQYLTLDQLAPDAITIADLPGVPPGLGVREYYALLVELLRDAPRSGGDGEGGDPAPDEAASLEDRAREALGRLMAADHRELDAHRAWEQIERSSAAEQRLVEQHIHGLLEQTHARVGPREWGRLPEQLRRYVRDLLSSLKPVVDWRRVLRLFAESSRRTRVKTTLRRPSRRYGTVPGIKIQRQHRVMVVIDTSGSIQMEQLQAFFAEVHHIWRAGAEVLVVECDAAIQQTYPYRGAAPGEVKGGGGTVFDPPIQLANDHVHPDAILYFTDAYAAPLTIAPRAPILWIVYGQVGPGDPYWEQLPGRKIALTPPTRTA